MSLTTHQREAANAIVNRIEAGKKYTSLTGYAGSGKTYLCGALTRQFTDVYACAPTHKAAWVLHDKIGMDTMTIHSFLGLKLVPDYSGGYKLIPQDDHETLDGTVILDESSMVGMDLWRYIEQTDCQWIFIGDPAQLPPVAQKPAPVLNFDGGHLDKVVRQQQGNPILEVATRIRKGQKPYLTGSAMREGKGVGVTHDSEAFRTSAARLFQDHADDPRHVRILAYRNQVVKAYNREIREAIYGSSDLPRFMEGDWLQLQDSFYDEANVPLAQNSEEVKVLGVDQVNRMSAGGRWRCWELKVKRRNDETVRLPVLHESESDRYAEKRQEYKTKALKAQKDMNDAEQPGERNRLNRKRKGYWKDYYRLDEDFADVRYCFAQTVHKCVAPDTLVETPSGLERIKDIPDTGYIAGPRGMQRYYSKVSNHEGPAFKITTENGFQLTVTPEHGLDVWNGSEYIRQEVQKLSVGSFLRFHRGATAWPKRYAYLPPAPTDLDVRAKRHSIPTALTPEVAEFLGLMVADGTVYKRGFRLVKRHEETRDRFSELCHALFGLRPKQPEAHANTFTAEVHSVQVAEWLLSIEGLAPNGKHIPSQILKSPRGVQQAFVRGLLADGGVNLTNGKFDHIELSQQNEKMLRTLQVMLLRLGIVAHYRCYKNGLPRLYIYGSEAATLREQVGFISKEKSRRLALCEGKALTSHQVPVAPGEIDLLRQKHPSCFKAKWVSNDAKRKGYFSRRMALDVANRLNGEASWLSDRLEYHHERIKSIKEVSSPSMCVEVPNGHQFFQNACAGWNSQGSTFDTVYVDYRDITKCRGAVTEQALAYVAATRPENRLAFLV